MTRFRSHIAVALVLITAVLLVVSHGATPLAERAYEAALVIAVMVGLLPAVGAVLWHEEGGGLALSI